MTIDDEVVDVAAELVVTDKRHSAAPVERAAPVELQVQHSPNPLALVERAISGSVPPETLEKMMALAERWEEKEAKKSHADAMSKFLGDCPVIPHDCNVDIPGGAKYTHASIASIGKTVDPVLSKYGLSKRWEVQQGKESVTVTCIVTHRDGHSTTATITSGPDKGPGRNAIQAIKSAITYLKRGTAELAMGIVTGSDGEDDGAGSCPPQNTPRDEHNGGSRRPEPEPEPSPQEKLAARVKHVEQLFHRFDRAVLLADIEERLETPSTHWTDEHFKRMEAWRALYKAAENQEQREAVTDKIFDLPQGARG